MEILIKRMLGKISVPDDLAAAAADVGIVELDYSHADAAALDLLPRLVRHDPFDRLFAAQATARNLRLITADLVLLGLGLPTFEDARR